MFLPFCITHLWFVKPHVVAHNVELCDSRATVAFDPVGIEGQRIPQLVTHRQGKHEIALLSEAVQHVEHGAAGRLVGLEEHDVGVGLAGAQGGSLGVRG